MTRATYAQLNLGALRHNLGRVRGAAPGRRVMAAVKADGYGHGALNVATALAGETDGFAVACLEEALVLRAGGVRSPIMLLGGLMEAAELDELEAAGVETVIHDDAQLRLLTAYRPRGGAQTVWVKIDSGMHRLGFSPEQVPRVWEALRGAEYLYLRGWMTHLACADDPDDPYTSEQIPAFKRALAGLPGERSIANSAGVLAWPDSHADTLRPGIMLYGASPLLGRDAASLDLKPVMTLTTRLLSVHTLPAGAKVGYGATYRCPETMLVGVAEIGYGDGYPRKLANGTPLLVNGRRSQLIGRVSMDMICVDLRRQPEARPGDPVVLWGEGLSAEEVAAAAGTIAYELFCQLTPRVRRIIRS